MTLDDESYEAFRNRRFIDKAVPVAAVAITCVLGWMLMSFVRQPQGALYRFLPYIGQLAVPIAVVGIARRATRPTIERVTLVASVCWMSLVVSHQWLPHTSATTNAAVLMISMFSTALFFPWRPTYQAISAGSGAAIFFMALRFTRTDAVISGMTYPAVLPLVAAVFSIFGSRVREQTQRELFEQQARLRALGRATNAPLAEGEPCDQDHITVDSFARLGATPGQNLQANLLKGLSKPRLLMPPGQIERWRILDASFLDEVQLAVFKGRDSDCQDLDLDAGPIPLTQIGGAA